MRDENYDWYHRNLFWRKTSEEYVQRGKDYIGQEIYDFLQINEALKIRHKASTKLETAKK